MHRALAQSLFPSPNGHRPSSCRAPRPVACKYTHAARAPQPFPPPFPGLTTRVGSSGSAAVSCHRMDSLLVCPFVLLPLAAQESLPIGREALGPPANICSGQIRLILCHLTSTTCCTCAILAPDRSSLSCTALFRCNAFAHTKAEWNLAPWTMTASQDTNKV